jgi:hypothetical protein
MTTTQALAEADRRREIAGFAAHAADEVDVGVLKAQLAALQAAASTAAAPAAATDAGAMTSTPASHSAAPMLSRLRDAERALRLAHSLLKTNGQRRNGFIAKLSESLAAASERASALEAEAGQAQAALQRLQELAAAAADGKTLRRPRPEATSPLSSDSGAAGFASFTVAAAMRGGVGRGGEGVGTWAMPTDGSAGLEAYLGIDGHAGGGDGAGAFAWGLPGGDGTVGADGLQYWPHASDAGAGADAVAGARLLDAYAAEGDEVQRAAEDEAAAAVVGGADDEHDSRAYVPSGAPSHLEAGRSAYGDGRHADDSASGAAAAHAATSTAGGAAARHPDAVTAEWDAYFGADSAADGSATAEAAGAGWGSAAGAPPATKRPRREDSGGSSGRAAAGGAAGLGGGEMLSVDDLAAEEGIALPSASPAGSSVGGTGLGSKATGRAAGSAAGAEAAPLDIQSLIGPGKRWDGLRGMWVDEEEKRPAVEDAWRDH